MAKYKRRRRKHMKAVSLILMTMVLVIAYITLNLLGISLESLFAPEETPPPTPKPTDETIRVHVINVDQADCILIETNDGCMLIDTGIDKSETHLKNYLHSCGITEIDYLLITHPHTDHYGGADMILNDFKVENLIYDNYLYPSGIIYMFENSGANLIDVEVGDKYYLGEAEFTVLCADMADPSTDKNDYSIVVRLDYGEASFMFTGDATTFNESYILELWEPEMLDCDFLKSPHHGSKTSSSVAYLNVLTPDIVAVSAGIGNSYGLPKQEILDRYEKIGAEIYRTDILGDLVFVSDGATVYYDEDYWN